METQSKQGVFFEALKEMNKEYTISSIFNKLSKKTVREDNHTLKGWELFKRKRREDIKNDIDALILKHPKGYGIFVNHFAKKFWDKERKTASAGITWNLYTKVVENKGKCSPYFVLQLLAKLATMEPEKFNRMYNFASKYKPKKSEVAELVEANS